MDQVEIFRGIDPEFLHQYKSGDTIAIKYNKENKKEFVLADLDENYISIVVFVFFFLFCGVLMGFLFLRYLKKFMKYRSIEKNGISANGKIVDISDSTFFINGAYQKNIKVEFLNRAKTIKHIDPNFLGNKKVGDNILIKYDPRNHNDFIIDSVG